MPPQTRSNPGITSPTTGYVSSVVNQLDNRQPRRGSSAATQSSAGSGTARTDSHTAAMATSTPNVLDHNMNSPQSNREGYQSGDSTTSPTVNRNVTQPPNQNLQVVAEGSISSQYPAGGLPTVSPPSDPVVKPPPSAIPTKSSGDQAITTEAFPYPIYFYDKNKPFYAFTNFSAHPVEYKGKRYPTSEHLFQAFKFLDDHPKVADRIRKCGDAPMMAFDEAHRQQKWVRSDWKQVNVEKMKVAIRLKFTQHPDLKAMLIGTGNAKLFEDSPPDYFWGIGADRSGRNELGKALMELREALRNEPERPSQSSVPQQNVPGSYPPAQDSPLIDLAPGTIPTNMQSASVQGPQLCEFCQDRPKRPSHPYCGRTCATNAKTLCSVCRKEPRLGTSTYCSTACKRKADGVTLPSEDILMGDATGEIQQTTKNTCILCGKAVIQDDLCAPCTPKVESGQLINIPEAHNTFKGVSDQFKASWKHASACPTVRRVLKIVEPASRIANYEAYRASVEQQGNFVGSGRFPGNEENRWHGPTKDCSLGDNASINLCSSRLCTLCGIIHESYRSVLYSSAGLGRFGRGIYTSSSSSKSNDCSRNVKFSKQKAILLNKVVVGKGYKMTGEDRARNAPPQGFNSIFGDHGNSSQTIDEVVCYKEEAIRPTYLVIYDAPTITN